MGLHGSLYSCNVLPFLILASGCVVLSKREAVLAYSFRGMPSLSLSGQPFLRNMKVIHSAHIQHDTPTCLARKHRSEEGHFFVGSPGAEGCESYT